jgi:UDP-N-acetylglucosamine--N-acetylmuramyl-(pentapeptide) pyrophosphoryl-undecaprenol N-acetylglucosamine transferase
MFRGDKRPKAETAPRLMVVGGGTGGHVYPGVAIAEAWLERVPGGEVVFVGSQKGLEARVIPALGHPFVTVEARRLKNAGLLERLKSLLRMPAAIWEGRRVVRAHDPAAVIGVGGYVSGPVVLAASLAGRPCAVAEQNARPGLTNRILSRFVQRVYTAFPEALSRFTTRKVRELGNPVRRAFLDAVAVVGQSDDQRRILVLGGSQGARALNEMLPPAFASLLARRPEIHVVHQTGRHKDAPVRAAYTALGIHQVEVRPFIDDMASAIAAADLVVARAGATTVAELAVVGRPALFIPFPFAADDHQAANAASLVSAGAALMEREEDLDAHRIASLIEELLSEPGRLPAMAAAARERGRPEAANAIVDNLCELAGVDIRAGAAA